MKLLVTGVEGQVVRSLLARAPAHGHEIVAVGRPKLDLAHPDTVGEVIRSYDVDAVVSSAAYTAVDRAETEQDLAFAVNAGSVAALASAARDMGVPLVHLSTDYVFDGSKPEPYVESDATGPIGVYGASKLAGEQEVLRIYPDNSAILRTAWVYSPYGANFLKTMLRLAADRDELNVVNDQLGNPTSALDIADTVLAVASRLSRDNATELRGVFHMSASEEATWAEFARSILEYSGHCGGPTARVKGITTAEYPTPAKRPANSRLNCGKLARDYGLTLPAWSGSMKQIIDQLVSE